MESQYWFDMLKHRRCWWIHELEYELFNKNGHTLLHMACKTEYNHIEVAGIDIFCVEVIEIVIEGKIEQVLGEVIL